MADEKILSEEVATTPSNFIYDFIDEDLADQTQKASHQKCFDIFHLSVHLQ